MDRFMREAKGAISIFLALVLLPMMMVASIFVDTARINLGKSMAESAGDLTLNTALTNYDSDLKNLYGLFATSQNMEELMASLEDYYRDSIIAAGVDSAAADDYVGQIMDYLKTTTGTDDLMNIQLTDFEVEAPAGGDLGNPAILKSQIVEFMKYRAPLSLGTGFLDALGAMKNLSKQTKLVENKNKFYEQHQTVLTKLEAAWWQLELYQYADSKSDATGFPDGSYVGDRRSTMNWYASNSEQTNPSDWQEMIKMAVKYLYYHEDYGDVHYKIILNYKCPDCGNTNNASSSSCSCGAALSDEPKYKIWTFEKGSSKQVLTSSYTEDNPASTDNVLKVVNDVLKAIANVDKYNHNGNELYKLIQDTKASGSEVCKIYTVAKFNQAVDSGSDYCSAIKEFLQALVTLQAALETCDADELSNIKVNGPYDVGGYQQVELSSAGGTPLNSFAMTQLNAHYKLDPDDESRLDIFNKTTATVESFYDTTVNNWDNYGTNVGAKLNEVRDYAAEFKSLVETKSGNLQSAIDLLGEVRTMLTNTDGDYYKNLEAWKTSANNLSEDTMGKNSQSEIEEITSIVTVDRIDSLVTRLTGAKETLDAIKTQIDNYKFADTSWSAITDGEDYTILVDLFSTWDSQIQAVKPTSDSSYDSIASTICASVAKGTISDDYCANGDKSVNLTKEQRELYTWMYNNFYTEKTDYSEATQSNKTASANTDADKAGDVLGNMGENKPDPNAEQTGGTELKDREVKTWYECPECKTLNEKSTKNCASCGEKMVQTQEYISGTLPSTRWNDTVADIVSGTIDTNADSLLASANSSSGNMLEELLDLASNMGAELRDNLYVTQYIMSMFSYDTIERETFVDNKKAGETKSYGAFWTAGDDGSAYTQNADYADYAALVKSETNNAISPNMNYLYQGEVEYILYGDSGTEKVYGTIFVIRFALNTVYAFTDAEINNVTTAAATALFGTPPLTPMIPLAKAAMTIGLAIAESAWDLVELRKGEAIPLMKNKETWVMSPSGIAGEVKEELKATAEVVVSDLVDKGYQVLNNAIEMTSEELQNMIAAGGNELGKLASAATETVSSEIQNKANEALQKVVELCNAENQKAMLNADFKESGGLGATATKVENVKSALNEWLNQQTGDEPAIYQAKQIAVQYLTENNSQLIADIFNSIKSESEDTTTTGTVDPATAVEETFAEVLKRIKEEIDRKITNAITTGVGALGGIAENIEGSLKSAAAEGADKLKEVLGGYIDNAFGSVPTANGTKSTASTNAMASLLSWQYSDYLRIFVTVGLFANEELMLLRLADMLELNMQTQRGEYAVVTTTERVTTSRFFGLWKSEEEKDISSVNDNAFTLSKAYTYLRINATLQVKPLLMTMPFMAPTVENNLTGTDWYEIEYSGTLGY